MVSIPDSTPPSTPDGLDGWATSGSRIELVWNDATDNVDVSHYEIYRDGSLAGTTTETSYVDEESLQLLTSYAYEVVAVDISDNPSTASDSVVVSTLGQIVEVLVGSASDDAEEELDGTVVLGSSDLDMVDNGAAGLQVVGLRFSSVAVPQFVEVLSAWITFTADGTETDPASLVIRAEDSGNAAPFTTDPMNLSTRSTTTALVAWDNLPQWPAEHYFHSSPDLTLVVQELFNHPDWAEGNAMAFLISGTGLRRVKSFEGGYVPWLRCPRRIRVAEYPGGPTQFRGQAEQAG